jgi:GNAT superfamily N-acetyltransferase
VARPRARGSVSELREIAAGETGLAFEAMRALRTHYDDQAEFVRRVDEVQRAEGYRIVGAFEGERCVAVAGFRELNTLAWGHVVYVDDLSTHPEARGRGHGRALLEWCAEEAKRLGCEQLHLDSGVEANRLDAHRLYLNTGMRITSFHFMKPLGAEPAASAKRPL